MKSYTQLAQSAYETYAKKAIEVDEEGLAGHATPWPDLDTATQQCWIAVAQQLWAELALVH